MLNAPLKLSCLTLLLTLCVSLPAQGQPSSAQVTAGIPPSLPHTTLARPPLQATLRCVTCPLEAQDTLTERVVTLELKVSLARPAQVPLKLTLEALPAGWSLKEPLPSSLLTRALHTSLTFDVLIDEQAQIKGPSQRLKLTLSYRSALSGLSKTLRLCPAQLYGEGGCALDRPKLSPALKGPPRLKLPRAPFPAQPRP